METDRPAVCVIAQQYSSVTLVPLRSHSRKEKLGARLKMLPFYFLFFFYLLNCVTLKFRKVKLSDSGSVCNNILFKPQI